MELSEYLSISGLPGLFKLKSSRGNGIIATNLSTGQTSFVSSRKHQFSPLESIGIYKNDGDTESLKAVLEIMVKAKADVPAQPSKLSNPELISYMETIMPDFDKDMVKPRDIKKLVTWFNILDKNGDFVAAPKKEETKK